MTTHFIRTPVAQACAAVVIAGTLGAFAPSLYAATAAGTQIKNLATVTYEDAAGNVYSAQSNEAVVTVAQVYSATVGVDTDATAAAGQTVYLPYVLTNTGNGADVFDLTAVDDIASVTDNLTADGITIFRDLNRSGEPDAGEPAVTQLSLQAGEIVNLVVAVEVPATATATQTLGITLTAQAQNGTGIPVAQSVTDLTTGGGRDTLDGTNESLITVSGDAVLVTTKSSVHDAAARRLTYTITVRNNGTRSADDVVIFDALPAGTTLVSSSVSGLLGTNLDTTDTSAQLDEAVLSLDLNADGDQTDTTEALLGLDLNQDGDQADSNVDGVYAIDAELPAQTSVSLTFTVEYTPTTFPGGYTIQNQGHAAGDTNQNGTANSLVSSNITQDTIGSAFAVDIADTGAGDAPGVNDGGDDDGALNDIQFVDVGAAGGTVVFTSIVTNNGNSDDIFELAVNPGDFPAGTVFTFFDQSGVVQLTDTNGSSVDTGVIAAGASRQIVIKASLPSNATPPATDYTATVTATSAGDTSATPATDATSIVLGDVIVATADIHNGTGGTIGTDDDALTQVAGEYVAITTFPGQTGNIVEIPLYVDNETGGADSYSLAAGSSWDSANTVLGSLPQGWSVQFFATDGTGNATGNAISNTQVIPAGTVDMKFIAAISVPNDATLAIDDLVFDNDADSTAETLDGNNDGDGDYPIFFRLSSINTGASDVKLDAIDVNATRQLSLVSPGSNQINPGGTVDYGHTLSNNGNVAETVELTSSNNQAGFTHSVSIDTDGDGVADTALGNLVAPNGTVTITVEQSNGVDITVTVTDADGDGNPELEIEPGESLPLTATVFAPSNAAPGTIDTLSIVATNVDTVAGSPSVQVDDQTTVIDGQVRLAKTVAIDTDCDGTPESTFAATQNTAVEPGQCAIWQVVATNQGAADAQNVTITDAVTAYSSYDPGSLRYCLSNGCTLATVTDAADGDNGTLSGSNITFYVGDRTAAGPTEGGVLIPGEQATARFSVEVQ